MADAYSSAKTTSRDAAMVYASSVLLRPGAGLYYQGQQGLSTSAALGNGSLRLAPIFLGVSTPIASLFAEFTVAGDAASLFAPAIYADNGAGYPGALAVTGPTISTGSGNAGAVASGGTPGVYQGVVAVTLPPGLYWIGGAVQGVTVTQPTMKTAVWNAQCIGTAALPVAGNGVACYSQSSVTGALPATFGAGQGTSGASPPRVGFKVT